MNASTSLALKTGTTLPGTKKNFAPATVELML